jgi:hypothetical protein
MVFPPLPSLLIATGLMLLSILVVARIKNMALFGKPALLVLSLCGVLLLALGFFLHFSTPPASVKTNAPPLQTGQPDIPRAGAGCTFSFEPESVRWGEEVTIRVVPEPERVTIYYNGTPLPYRGLGKGTFVVTIPSISKSGYFTLDCNGTKVNASDELVVSAK